MLIKPWYWPGARLPALGIETVICRVAPGAKAKVEASIAGTARWSSDFTVTVNVSETGPTLVTLTVSDALMADPAAPGKASPDVAEPPVVEGARKSTELGETATLLWRAASRSR